MLMVSLSLFVYHSGFSDYCLHLYCYIHNVLADVSSEAYTWHNGYRHLLPKLLSDNHLEVAGSTLTAGK